MEVKRGMTFDVLREKVRELANIYLPDGIRPMVDVFKRVRARRVMRELLLQHYKDFFRSSPQQLIDFLFFGDERMVRKVTLIYGRG